MNFTAFYLNDSYFILYDYRLSLRLLVSEDGFDPRPDFNSPKKLISVGSTYKLSRVDFSFGFSVYEALRFNFESFVISRLFSGSRILLILRRFDFEGLAADCTAYAMN